MARRIKVRIPKRVAGIKIPKQLRKSGLNSFLNSSGGQVVIAEALMLLAGALAIGKRDPYAPTGDALRHPLRAGKRALSAAGAGGQRARQAISDNSSRLSYAFASAAAAFRDAMHEDISGHGLSTTDRPSMQNEGDPELATRRDPDADESAAVIAAEESRGKKKRQTSQTAATGSTAASNDTPSSIPH